ncbi:hypothetical protein CYLTODRAFT_426618 [Cylindrobasidium torrendii FP15055 ss-10]|uniref:Uncharacterized protein n=1 Tax=Cylindrobasidium torrendii FP15055 ss-10 TaxID=1314674 RepID=A0A0D7AX95_9AGAR|nr:hypothetical protein CYLTODRAFT_426618 [Cylindrobasidium torrendii FP15055 ss-10]
MLAVSSETDQFSERPMNHITNLSNGTEDGNMSVEPEISMGIKDEDDEDEDLASTQGGRTPTRDPPQSPEGEGNDSKDVYFASATIVSDTSPSVGATPVELSTPSPPPIMNGMPSLDVDIPGLNVLRDIDTNEVAQNFPAPRDSTPVLAPQLSEEEASSRLCETLRSAVLTNSKLRQPDLDLDSLSMKLSDTLTRDDGQRLLSLLRSSISAESLHRVQKEFKKPKEASQPQTALEQEAVDLINDVIAEETRRHYTQTDTDTPGQRFVTPEQMRARLASSHTVQSMAESTSILRATNDPSPSTWSYTQLRPEVSPKMDTSRSVSPAFSMHSSNASSSVYKTSPERRRSHQQVHPYFSASARYRRSQEQLFNDSGTAWSPPRYHVPLMHGQHPDYHFDRERNYGDVSNQERARWPPADARYGDSYTEPRHERGQWREGYGYDYPKGGFGRPPPASAPAFVSENASGFPEHSRLRELDASSTRSWEMRRRSHSPPARWPTVGASDMYGREHVENRLVQKLQPHSPIKSSFDFVAKNEHEMKIDKVPPETLPVPGQWARYEAGPGSSVWEHTFVIGSAQAQAWNVWAEGQGRRSDVTRQVRVQVGCSVSHGETNGNVTLETEGSMGQWPPKGTILIEVNPGTPVGRLVVPDDELRLPVDITHTLKEGDNIVRLAQLDSVGDGCAYVLIASWLEIPHSPPSFLNNSASSIPAGL